MNGSFLLTLKGQTLWEKSGILWKTCHVMTGGAEWLSDSSWFVSP